MVYSVSNQTKGWVWGVVIGSFSGRIVRLASLLFVNMSGEVVGMNTAILQEVLRRAAERNSVLLLINRKGARLFVVLQAE